MKYMLMMHAPRAGWEKAGIATWPVEDLRAHIGFMHRLNKDLQAAGEFVVAEGLASAEVRLGTSAGTHIVEARVADASGGALRATFDLNALERGKKGKDRHDDDEEDDD